MSERVHRLQIKFFNYLSGKLYKDVLVFNDSSQKFPSLNQQVIYEYEEPPKSMFDNTSQQGGNFQNKRVLTINPKELNNEIKSFCDDVKKATGQVIYPHEYVNKWGLLHIAIFLGSMELFNFLISEYYHKRIYIEKKPTDKFEKLLDIDKKLFVTKKWTLTSTYLQKVQQKRDERKKFDGDMTVAFTGDFEATQLSNIVNKDFIEEIKIKEGKSYYIFQEGFWYANFKKKIKIGEDVEFADTPCDEIQQWVFGCTPLHFASGYARAFKEMFKNVQKKHEEEFDGEKKESLNQEALYLNEKATVYFEMVNILKRLKAKEDTLTLFEYKTPEEM